MQYGLDYYIENGKWIFTSKFLLERKRCCNSGCRHCPYKKMNIELGKYIWKSKTGDIPVTVIGFLGEKDGKTYAKIAEGNTGIATDELVKVLNLNPVSFSRKPISKPLF
jgi:Family of unknown function (DUF5522)